MPVTVRIGTLDYIIDGLLVFGGSPDMRNLLNAEAVNYQLDGGGGDVPWPDLDFAEQVAETYGGEIVETDPPKIVAEAEPEPIKE